MRILFVAIGAYNLAMLIINVSGPAPDWGMAVASGATSFWMAVVYLGLEIGMTRDAMREERGADVRR